MTAAELINELNSFEDPARAVHSQRFFKTGKGQYGEGDVFIGLTVPQTRLVCKKYKELPIDELEKLLESPIHEHRLAAVIIMRWQAERANSVLRKSLYDLYLRRTDRINNWDIIDISCHKIVGAYIADKDRAILYKLARSKQMWERRIAIVSTAYFIDKNDLEDTFKIAKILLNDEQDLIHKATGWMLREAGKKDEPKLKEFLDKYASTMPRTMLRYSIEKLHPADRAHYMKLK
ncbi:MAG TPA: DNA alkylation repair protein [Candidatus Saccharibacteria bacterium]|nr:DNA alkylation repair protein [Candidatus Saccharibacteria bacterium]